MVLITRLFGVICFNFNEQEQILVNNGLINYIEFTLSLIYPDFQYVPLSKVIENQAKNNKQNQTILLLEETCWLLSNIVANR